MSRAEKQIVFNRETRLLQTPDWKSALQARAMQISHRALAPLGYLGVSRIHNAINRFLRPRTDTLIVEKEWSFRFPSNDYYWNRLLDGRWDYEPEIEFVLRSFSKIPFVFVDLGANFGFWSSRVGSGRYGNHLSIAVEPSDYCVAILTENTANSLHAVRVWHRAIDAVSGRQLNVYGQRHAGFSIDQDWYGASRDVVNTVETISIDELLDRESVDSFKTPTIIKLDVEGVELRALQGGSRTVGGASAWLIEDADLGGASPAVEHAYNELGMRLFNVSERRIREISSLSEVRELKAHGHRLQGGGVNLFGTRSSIWLKAVRRQIEEAYQN